ncbi:MAG: four helix bundle protein [Planctomycetota bacterium]|jgi:four helix bundle protein
MNGFAHQRLDAYWIAQELMAGCVHLTRLLPRGFSDLRDQIRRSALATVRHIAEGSARSSAADKRARFHVARGEVAELDASLHTAIALDLVARSDADRLRALAGRVGAMLTGLIARESRRVEVVRLR